MTANTNDNGQNRRSLPEGWEWKTVGKITLPIEKVYPAQEPDKEFTYLDIASIDNSVHKITEPKSYYGVDAPSRARQLVQANDVLFSTVRTYLEKIAQVPEIYDGQIASTGFSVLRANEFVLPKYLFYYSLTQEFLKPLNELQRGTSYPAVRDSDIRTQLIPVAPLSEQEQIVSRIEELFSDLEAGVAALERVRAGLKRYKASVLKAACEGKIFESRVVGSIDELPQGWQRGIVGDFAFVTKLAGFEYTKFVTYQEVGEIPVVRAQNVSPNGFREGNFVFVGRELTNQLTRSRLFGGEVLMVFVGAGLGNVGIVPEGKEFFLGPNVALIRPKEKILVNKYLYYFLQSGVGRRGIFSFSKATAQGSISMGNIRSVPILIPPLDEQGRIVAEVERRLSVVREVESAVEVGLVRAGRLRQAVLRSAFDGRL